MDHSKFASVPRGLKESIAELIGVKAQDVILANSASYGIHILANGIPWRRGDEIIVMQNDFPTNILPWLALARQGVKVCQVSPGNKILNPREFLQSITSKTRLCCFSSIHTFSGWRLALEEFSQICREKGIIFVLNISQGLGAESFNAPRSGADAVVCAGYKWLCGPYGTGFVWMKPGLRESLIYNQAYWIASLSAQDLESEGNLNLREIKTARKFDVFGTANFFNFVPFKAALDYWLKVNLEEVKRHNQSLIELFLKKLNSHQYDLISPREEPERSNLVVISHKIKAKNRAIFKTLQSRGIYTALWKGNIRVSAHIYNLPEEIEILSTSLKREGIK